jgi:MATE family multidrug resistance protein
MALDPVVAQAVGARDSVAIARGLQRGLLLSVGISVLSSIALLPGEALLGVLRQPVEVQPIAASFARVSAWGTLPFFIFIVLRRRCRHSRVRPIVWRDHRHAANAILDWLLVFGNTGAPRMGDRSAYASTGAAGSCVLRSSGWASILQPYLHEPGATRSMPSRSAALIPAC